MLLDYLWTAVWMKTYNRLGGKQLDWNEKGRFNRPYLKIISYDYLFLSFTICFRALLSIKNPFAYFHDLNSVPLQFDRYSNSVSMLISIVISIVFQC